jgi:hypothetical protein
VDLLPVRLLGHAALLAATLQPQPKPLQQWRLNTDIAACQLAPLLSKLGSLAMLLAMRLASSRVSELAISIALIGVTVDIGESLSVRVHNLEAAV